MRRAKKIVILVHPEDVAAYKAAANLCGQTMAGFIRHIARVEADKLIREHNLPLPPEQQEKEDVDGSSRRDPKG